jgi:hypothetical protein
MLREGITKLQAQYQNLLKQREAKYHPQVVETYRERGGFTSQSPTAPAAAPAAPRRRKYNPATGTIE